MQDLLARIKAQKLELSRRRSVTGRSRAAGESVEDPKILSQWKTFKGGHLHKNTMVLHEPWLEYKVFKKWWNENHKPDLQFCFYFSLEIPQRVGPKTCVWVHPEAATFINWVYKTRVRRKAHSYHPPGCRYLDKIKKIEGVWTYDGKILGNYRSHPDLWTAQAKFRTWLLDRLDTSIALVADDELMAGFIKIRSHLLHCIENRKVFEFDGSDDGSKTVDHV